MPNQFLSQERQRLARELLKKRGLNPHGHHSIPRRSPTGPAPLSFAQMRLWYHEQLYPSSALFNTPVVFELIGLLDPIGMGQAFDKIIERHESLRTVFRLVDGEPRQHILPAEPRAIPIEDLSRLPVAEQERLAMRFAEAAVREPIDLAEGPVFNVKLVKLNDERWWLLVLSHHVVFDAWSMALLMREIAGCYGAATGRGGTEPPDLPVQYADFSAWQRSPEMHARLQEQLEYWLTKLRGAPTFLALPTDRPRPPVQTFKGNSHAFAIRSALFVKLEALARASGVTSFAVMTAALNVLLFRITGQEDQVISTGVATRHHREIENLIGCFINILLLRTDLSGKPSFRELLKQVGETSMAAFSNQDLPFERLVSALSPERDLSHNPLAQVMIVFHNAGLTAPEVPGLRVRRVMPEKSIAQYDLLLHLRSYGPDLSGMLEYSVDLFDASTARRLCEQFMQVLESVAECPDAPIDTISVVPRHQEQALLALNDTAAEFPRNLCIQELVERRAASQPDSAAVETASETLSYCQLNNYANRLASRLIQFGVGRGDIIGVSVDRSPAMVTALLAVVKSGAAYVPIDPDYPPERIRFIVTDANAKLLVTQSSLEARFSEIGGVPLVCLDREADNIALHPSENLDVATSPGDLLYVIFTSGSTGAPKGVMLDHLGRVNNFNDFNTRFNVGPGDKVLAVSSLSFDMCAYDVFGTLMAGATIVLPSSAASPAPDEWGSLISRHRVTIWQSAPALLSALLDRFESGHVDRAPSLRLALLGGDWIPLGMADAMRRYARKGVQVVSLGGATEVSVHSTIYEVGDLDPNWSSVPYGVPMANQTAFVFDEQLRLVPVGVPGELYLGGVGVGWGYYRRAGLTAQRFVPNPYATRPGERVYRTGDIARWTNAGMLELLGRVDHQVKINGVRIELGEVDAALINIFGVKECVTTLHKPAEGQPRLVSYIVPDGPGFSWESAQHTLFERLPAFMIPRQHMLLDKLPLSPNGKVLRRGLPAPAGSSFGGPAVDQALPRSVLERMLHTLWTSVLSAPDFGIDDDFFDLGGTSLQAALLVNRMPHKMNLVEFLRYSTIRKQAALLSSSDRPVESRLFRFPASAKSRVTLLCVPYGGGSSIAFRNLANALPKDIATTVVCMPSADDAGSSCASLETIAAQCIDQLHMEELTSLAVYGHCAGTVLATELCRQLRARGHEPVVLFLAAVMPPDVPTSFAMPRQTEEEILDFVAALGGIEESGSPDDWTMLVRDFRRDSRLIREYLQRVHGASRQPLDVPIVVLTADDDPITKGNHAHYDAWKTLSSRVEFHALTGGHYFVSKSAMQVASIVAAECSNRDGRVRLLPGDQRVTG